MIPPRFDLTSKGSQSWEHILNSLVALFPEPDATRFVVANLFMTA